MKLKKTTLILLMLNIIIMPLTGNHDLYVKYNFDFIVKITTFVLPTLYFLSFIRDVLYEIKNINKNKIFNVINISIMFCFFAFLLSSIFGIIFNFKTITHIITFVFLFGFVLTIQFYEIDDFSRKKIIKSILLSFALVSTLGLLQHIFKFELIYRGIEKYPGALGRISSTAYLPTVLDKYLIFNLVFSFYLIFKQENKRLILYLLSFVGAFALALTYSRAGMITFYFSAFIFLLAFIYKKQVINFLFLVLLIVFVYFIPGQKYVMSSTVIFINEKINNVLEKANLYSIQKMSNTFFNFFIVYPPKIEDRIPSDNINQPNEQDPEKPFPENGNSEDNDVDFIDYSNESRQYFKNVATAVIREYPIFGIGPGNYNHIYQYQNVNDYLKKDIDIYIKYMFPHSFYYHFTAEIGLFGVLSLFTLLAVMIVKTIKSGHTLFAIVFYSSFLLLSYSESILYMKEISFTFMIIAALMLNKNFIKASKIVKKDKRRKFNVYFSLITLICLSFMSMGIIVIRGQKTVSVVENRTLNKIPVFSYKKFNNGVYQKKLEDGLVDQILLGTKIKEKFKSFDSYTSKITRSAIQKIYPKICEKYQLVDSETNIWTYGCDNTLVNMFVRIDDYKKYIDGSINAINNSIKNIDKKTKFYLYFINTSISTDFTNPNSSIFDYFINNSKIQSKSQLNISSFEEYSKFFYHSDHHWNHIGIQRGYEEIIYQLLGSKEKTTKPIIERSYSKYYGSFSRRVVGDKYDIFKAYEYKFPKQTITINNKLVDNYGNLNYAKENVQTEDKYLNIYAGYYGGDAREIIVDNHNKKKGNLLIIKTSFANPLVKLISSHFNKTFVVDLRQYEKFNLKDYILKNKVDKVLFIGDLIFFTDQNIKWSDKNAFQ